MVRGKNFASIDFSKKTFVILLIVFSLSTVFVLNPLMGLLPGTLTISLPAGPSTIEIRDIDNTEPGTSTISGTVNPNVDVFVTVNHPDGNFDPLSADTVLASATSTSSVLAEATTTLTETGGVDSGIFTGTITLSSSTTTGSTLEWQNGDDVNLIYRPYPFADFSNPVVVDEGDNFGLQRALFTVDFKAGGGSVTVSDVSALDTLGNVPCDSRPVTDILNLEIVLGSLTSTDTTATISYANGLFIDTDKKKNLDMFYKKPGSGWFMIADSDSDFDKDSIDFTAKTVSSDLEDTFYGGLGGTVTEGQFFIGYGKLGCAGGGGGGFTRAGLVVNALAGLSAGVSGGGGSGPPGPTLTLSALALYDSAVEIISMPQEIRDIALNHDPYTPLELIIDIYEDFDLPFSINGNGFVLGGYENTIETQTIEPGEPTEFVVVYYITSDLAHSSLNFNLGPTRAIAGSDTQVLLNKDKPPEVIDPNGNIASFTGSINNEGDLKRVATFLVTFSESVEFTTSDLVIRSWSDNLSSGDTIIYDAIEIAQPEIVEIADEDLPEPEIQTLRSQYVPIWIKNNAAWWSQELIEDSDFVAGIEYLIQQEIITLTETGTLETNSSDEIPSWIKSNAGWWSEDLISEKEFIDGVQWLINIGVIKVVET